MKLDDFGGNVVDARIQQTTKNILDRAINTQPDFNPQMTSPSPVSALSGSSVTFNWTTGLNAVAYWLEVGTGLGQANLFTGGTGSTTHQTVTGLPVSGILVYVRLWTFTRPELELQRLHVHGRTANVTMTSPAPGSTLTGTTVTFNWTGATGASQVLARDRHVGGPAAISSSRAWASR